MSAPPCALGVGKGGEGGEATAPHPTPFMGGGGGGGGGGAASEVGNKVGVSAPAARPARKTITAESLGILQGQPQRLQPVAWTDPDTTDEPAQAWRWNEQRRTSFMGCRVSDIEGRWIRAAAAALNLSTSDYARNALMFYAGQTLRKVETEADD